MAQVSHEKGELPWLNIKRQGNLHFLPVALPCLLVEVLPTILGAVVAVGVALPINFVAVAVIVFPQQLSPFRNLIDDEKRNGQHSDGAKMEPVCT